MDEEMKVGIRLHKRLHGQNDVLDHELHYRVNRMTREQKRTCSQLDSDMKYLQKELSKTSQSSGKTHGPNEDISNVKNEWDKPSPTVLRARMVLSSAKPIKEKKKGNNSTKLLTMPGNIIRLEDLPRIKCEVKQRKATTRPQTENTNRVSIQNKTASSGRLERSKSVITIPSIVTEGVNSRGTERSYRQEFQSEYEHSLALAQQEMHSLAQPQQKMRRLSDTRHSSLDKQAKESRLSIQRRSLPNIVLDDGVRRNNEAIKLYSTVMKNTDLRFVDYLDIKLNRCVTPCNTERRIKMKRSAAFQIYKYLAEQIPKMSNQTIADIQKQKRENSYKRTQ